MSPHALPLLYLQPSYTVFMVCSQQTVEAATDAVEDAAEAVKDTFENARTE